MSVTPIVSSLRIVGGLENWGQQVELKRVPLT